ncbi:MAG: hypothetical protein U1D97_11420 [Desulfuromonadales bacterium]|nr:hypothetical protein [Desulfuromonadales bacterium]
MSSILKALRRLEQERARKSPVAPEIAASLLRHNPQRSSTPRWLWPTTFAVVGLLLAAALWFWRPVPQIIALPPTAAPLATTKSAGQGGELIIEEVIDQRKPILLPPPTPAVATRALPSAKGDQPVALLASKSLPPAQANKATPAVIEERQRPVVSAIAWQDDSAARMAVVDGLPVMTNEFVGNVKVQEIQRDRIVFAEGDTLFTVYVDAQ